MTKLCYDALSEPIILIDEKNILQNEKCDMRIAIIPNNILALL
jgi:hypothetical protein